MGGERKWNEVLTAPEAAQYLRIDIRSVWKLLAEGRIRGARVGRVWRVAKSELDRFLLGGADDG